MKLKVSKLKLSMRLQSNYVKVNTLDSLFFKFNAILQQIISEQTKLFFSRINNKGKKFRNIDSSH